MYNCFYKNLDTSIMAKTTGELKFLTSSVEQIKANVTLSQETDTNYLVDKFCFCYRIPVSFSHLLHYYVSVGIFKRTLRKSMVCIF